MIPLAMNYGRTFRSVFATLWSIGALLTSGVAWACAFHVTLPEKRIGDYILESSVVVLARENPAKHWSYKAIATLKGEGIGVKIDAFVDSSTRRKLAHNPDDTVLFARSRSNGSWRRISYVRAQNRGLYESLVQNSLGWAGPESQLTRFRFFSALHDHPDNSVRRIAFTELDRAAYRDLRQMQIQVSAHSLMDKLWNPLDQSLAPIRILMLGILGDAKSRAMVSRNIASAQTHNWSVNLGAWATAYVEINGGAGVDHLRSAFLARPGGSQAQFEDVLRALAVHGAHGDPEIQIAIGAAISEVLRERPERVVAIAKIFGEQGDYSRAELFTDTLRRHRLSPTEIISVATYVSIARRSTPQLAD